MVDSKSPLQSLTVLSAGAAAASSLLGVVGVHVDPSVIGEGLNTGLQVFSGIMSLVAIYGRVRASTRISA